MECCAYSHHHIGKQTSLVAESHYQMLLSVFVLMCDSTAIHCVFSVVCAVQKDDVQRIEQMNADYCLQIQELEHCICTRDLPSSHLHNT